MMLAFKIALGVIVAAIIAVTVRTVRKDEREAAMEEDYCMCWCKDCANYRCDLCDEDRLVICKYYVMKNKEKNK